ncbi:MAG: hypothetical protein U9Q06_02210 [Nanoarchaeota archaeon]|nr:hypothetical protein [Nanoarchaeota archaeon]
MKKRVSGQIRKIFFTAVIMFGGLLLLKYLPMRIYGSDILFDASAHIVTASFVLYVIYFFVDQNKSWRIPYFIFAFAVIVIISLQRILANAHNDFGLLLGLLLALFSVFLPNWRDIKNKIEF